MATSQQRQQLAKQRKRKELTLSKLEGLIVRHYTKPHWVEQILRDGVIKLEGSNVIQSQPNYHALAQQYKLLGRYVWFTEDTANCVVVTKGAHDLTSTDLPFFEFAANTINIERWSDVRKKLTGNALLFANRLDDRARLVGDNPNKWWVSKLPVPIEKMIRVNRGTGAANNIGNPYESISKV